MTPHTDSTYHNFAHWLCIPWLRILTAHTMTPHTDCIPQIHISTDYTYHKIIDLLTRHTTNTHTPHTGCTYHNPALMLTAHSMTPHTDCAWSMTFIKSDTFWCVPSRLSARHGDWQQSEHHHVLSIWQQVSWFSPVDPKVFFFLVFFIWGGGGQ